MLGCITLMFLIMPCGTIAKSHAVDPSDVQAAYLYNFAKFVSWPESDHASAFSICTVGKDEFGTALDSVALNDSIQGHKIIVRHLSTMMGTETCQIVFISASEEPRLTRDLEAIREKPILTVSTIATFLDRGGMIKFILENNRVRFAVNLSAAERSHLSLSSELLKVALYVQPNAGEAKP